MNTRKVYVVWTNTDLTEGRGSVVPQYICALKATALRLAKGINVQGSNGEITESTVTYDSNQISYIGPVKIIQGNLEDEEKEKRLQERQAIARKIIGITKEELRIIMTDL